MLALLSILPSPHGKGRAACWTLLTTLALTMAAQVASAAESDAELPRDASPADPAMSAPYEPPPPRPANSSAPSDGTLFIREYRVQGARGLSKSEVERAVYPFLGPARTADDVEQARAALEQAYKDKGMQAASVQVPAQQARRGIVFLHVSEGVVGRLRVNGSRYFSLSQIKKNAPSLAPGRVVNFTAVTRDIVGLNQLPDRQVAPALRAGLEPGTVDIDLNVKDSLPLHGSVELNNRYSAATSQLRLNGSANYGNLWQLGHTIGFSFQISPIDLDDVQVYSAFYLARIPSVPWFSLLVSGTKQDSNVNTLGGIGVVGKGEIVSGRAIITLPVGTGFYHSITFGLDYKHYNQNISLSAATLRTPITYYPLSIAYGATWAGKNQTTELNGSFVYHLRGLGSDEAEFDFNRFKASGSFFYFRGDLAHTRDLPRGFEAFGKVQGQLADQPLLNSEQYSGGGLATVRGYLESEVLGDNAVFGTIELRSPSFIGPGKDEKDELRLYLFAEGGVAALNEPLPEQDAHFSLASVGAGLRFRVFQHLNGSLDLGLPLVTQIQTHANDARVTFRVWGDF